MNGINFDPRKKTCHGCNGRGWVETRNGDIKICPICHGKGYIEEQPIVRWQPITRWRVLHG